MTNFNEQQIGLCLRQARKQRKVSQTRMGKALGVHRNTLRRWESFPTPIPLIEFLQFCEVIALSPSFVLKQKESI